MLLLNCKFCTATFVLHKCSCSVVKYFTATFVLHKCSCSVVKKFTATFVLHKCSCSVVKYFTATFFLYKCSCTVAGNFNMSSHVMWRCLTLRFANLKDDWSATAAGITWRQICLLHCGSWFHKINMKCLLYLMGLHVRAKRKLVKMLLRRETRTTPRKALQQSPLAGRCLSQQRVFSLFLFGGMGLGEGCEKTLVIIVSDLTPPTPPPPLLPPIPHPAPRPWCPCFRFWRRKAGWKCTLI